MAERRHRRLPRLLRRGGRRAGGAPHSGPRAALPLARRRRPERGRRSDRPGRLLLRRLPAPRGDRPVLADDGPGCALRPAGRAGARYLQRLPGAVRGRAAAGRAAPQHVAALRLPPGGRAGRALRQRVHARVRAGRGAVAAGQAQLRALVRAGRPARRPRAQRPARAALRARSEPERVRARRRRRHERAGQRARPDAASRARGRRADRVRRRPRACSARSPRHCGALSPAAA